MLVISRKPSQRIFIGKDICITVVEINRGKIRLGIEAPREVEIVREEIKPARPTVDPLKLGHVDM